MNLASGLAQREREGPLWSLPHRLGAKTTFVVPPPPDPSRQRSRSASSSNSNSSDEDDESQPTTASGASDPAPLQPQQTDSVTDEPGNSPAAESSLWRLHRPTSSTQLFRANSSFVSRLHLAKRLDGHRGCVNSIHWNAEGTLLITGSDDCKLNIYSPGPHYKQLHNIRTGHSRNIFCAKFVPYTNDNTVVSCGMDGEIRCTQLGRERASALIYSSPMHMVLKMSFLPGSGSVFLSTHQDGTVRLFDLRLRENNPENIAVDLRSERGERVAVNSLAMCPLGSYKFALACADPIVRLYDVRMTGGASTGQNITENDRYKCLTKYCPRSVLETHSKRDNYFSINVTGVDFNELGEIAATYSRVDAYVFSTQPGTHHKELTSETAPNIDSAYYQVQTGYVQSYKGHKNVRTFLKEISFLGGNDYVTTGSDCGHAFVWHKQTGKLVNMLKADDSVVNGVAPHPHLPYLATCGIDSDGKVWEPGSEYTFNPEKAERVVGRNGGSDAEDDGDGVRISLLNLWNFLTMMRSREAGQRRDQEREGDGQAGEGQAQQEEEEEEEEEVEEEEEEEETTAQLIMDLEMVGVADEIRNRGNRLFKAEDYDAAEAEYSRALEHLFVLESPYEEVMRRKKRSRLLCLLNRAACNLKRQQWQRVVDDSTEVLAVQPSNVKALFRRAKALLELKHFDRSLRDILLAEQLSPGSEEIGALHQQLREARSSEPSLEAGGEEAAPEEVMDVEEKGAADDAAGGGDPMNES